jgi:hypothetical protein
MCKQKRSDKFLFILFSKTPEILMMAPPIFLLTIFYFTAISTADVIPCERVVAPDKSGLLKSCYMANFTSIDSPGFKISNRDPSIQKIQFDNNKNISFLPMNIDENFPDLTLYAASRCSIEQIFKSNFRNLKKLIKVFLDNNQITELWGGTFEDLTNLKELRLSMIS